MKAPNSEFFELKPPKVEIKPTKNTKTEIKKAKLMEDLVNLMYRKNTNGITSKYFQLMGREASRIVSEDIKEIMSWQESVEKAVKLINEKKATK